MTRDAHETLKHSVAFRVTDKEWRTLKKSAEKQNTSVPRLAKTLLFERIGFEPPKPTRNVDGQRARAKPARKSPGS